MPNAEGQVLKLQPRKRRPKTGCLTCRIRRVRCDEARPNCLRCTSTGRKCDGYDRVEVRIAGWRSDKESLANRILVSPGYSGPLSDLETLDCFRVRTSKAFAGIFGSQFWSMLVMQVADYNPIVRQAVIALSSVHRTPEAAFKITRTDCADKYHSEALSQYNLALAQTVRTLGGGDGPEVALILCLLFLCFELMLDNYVGAVVHLKHGMRILAGIENKTGWKKTYPGKAIDQEFRKIILQTVYLEQLWGRKRDIERPTVEETRWEFSSMGEACERLGEIGMQIQYDVCTNENALSKKSKQVGDAGHQMLLDRFHAGLTELLARRRSTLTAVETTGVAILQLRAAMLGIISTAQNSSSLEACTNAFESIITTAEKLVSEKILPAPNFSFDGGVVAPLYYTAVRCRDLQIRCRAIELLAQRPTREGIWSSQLAVNMARTFIAVEVERVGIQSLCPTLDETNATHVATGRSAGGSLLKIGFSMPPGQQVIKMHIGDYDKNVDATGYILRS